MDYNDRNIIPMEAKMRGSFALAGHFEWNNIPVLGHSESVHISDNDVP